MRSTVKTKKGGLERSSLRSLFSHLNHCLAPLAQHASPYTQNKSDQAVKPKAQQNAEPSPTDSQIRRDPNVNQAPASSDQNQVKSRRPSGQSLGVFRRNKLELGDLPLRIQAVSKKELRKQESYSQDLTTMNKSTLDLSRAAALAKRIKANGGMVPEQEAQALGASAPEANLTRSAEQTFVRRRKVPMSTFINTNGVKAEVSAHVGALQRAARKTLADNIQKSGLLPENSNAEVASAKIEQMVQDVVNLYVPLFERELRITLENDILDKLSQSEEV